MLRIHRGSRPRWMPVFAIVIGLTGAITIYDPTLTTALAQTVGIARGADLLIYIVTLAFIASWFYFYQKLRTLSNAITALVRELAIRAPRLPPQAGADDSGPDGDADRDVR